jgi:membrane-associated phospholipid phosphatase
MTIPTELDLQIAHLLARPLGKSELFDYAVQSGIAHGVLGGLWFAAALFVWYSTIPDHDDTQLRDFLAAIAGGIGAVLLTLLAAHFVSSVPPIHNGELLAAFPEYINRMPVQNSFPSQSTAVFLATALAMFCFRKWLGALLVLGTFGLGALPRMYVGGHFLSDVLAGAACGGAGYLLAAGTLHRLPPLPLEFRRGGRWHWMIALGAFCWMVELGFGFPELVWLRRAIGALRTGILP